MILFKFTLKLIEIYSVKAHMIFNWLLFNFQHNFIQNYKIVISLRNDLADPFMKQNWEASVLYISILYSNRLVCIHYYLLYVKYLSN
jgi:hypothetical protein